MPASKKGWVKELSTDETIKVDDVEGVVRSYPGRYEVVKKPDDVSKDKKTGSAKSDE
jgi:hypothetical protein